MNNAIPDNIIGLFNLADDSVQTYDADLEKIKFDAEIFQLFRKSVDDIKRLMEEGYTVACALSFGKDSTCCLLAHLQAYEEFLAENTHIAPSSYPLITSTIDTGVEAPYIQMHVMYESERLESYCKSKGWLLEMHISTPPLAESWSSLFLSSHKLLSGPALNNDCSIILKRDQNHKTLKKLMEKYGQDKLCVLLGSRKSESNKRNQSIQKNNNNVTVEEALLGNQKSLVFLPIKDWSVDHVFGLLMRAGTVPVTKPESEYAIPSYAEEHRLLKLIYGEASDSSCPVSAHKLKGVNKEGGCGKGSRFGCYVCLKSQLAKSETNQNKRPRYAHIQGNLTKIRDYMFFVASDINHRTFHARAIDHDTQHLALQPNTLKSKTIEYIATQLMMATVDDKARADKLISLIEVGTKDALMQDPGFADIVMDAELSEPDRQLMMEFYLKYASQHLVKPMSLKQALYLDALHSRDGVRLPPFRMTYLWLSIVGGHRIPYPKVNVLLSKVDPIPDAKMLHIQNLPMARVFRESDIIERDSRSGCVSESKPDSLKCTLALKYKGKAPVFSLSFQGKSVPITASLDSEMESVKGKLVGYAQKQGLTEAKSSVYLLHRKLTPMPSLINPIGIKSERYKEWSRRANKNIKRKGGGITSIEKGRASLQFYKFREESKVCRSHLQTKPIWIPSWHEQETFITNAVDEELNPNVSYHIEHSSLIEWMDVEGLERAIAKHNEFVTYKLKSRQSRYQYPGTGAFEHLMMMGVISMTQNAEKVSQRILNRTEMFNQMGLFELKDNHRLMELGKSMAEYRHHKAKLLLDVRKKRNESRKNTQKQLVEFNANTGNFVMDAVDQQLNSIVEHYSRIFLEGVHYDVLLKLGFTGFDTVNYKTRSKVCAMWLFDADSALTDIDSFSLAYLNKPLQAAINSDWLLKKSLSTALTQCKDKLVELKNRIKAFVFNSMKTYQAQYYWFNSAVSLYQDYLNGDVTDNAKLVAIYHTQQYLKDLYSTTNEVAVLDKSITGKKNRKQLLSALL